MTVDFTPFLTVGDDGVPVFETMQRDDNENTVSENLHHPTVHCPLRRKPGLIDRHQAARAIRPELPGADPILCAEPADNVVRA